MLRRLQIWNICLVVVVVLRIGKNENNSTHFFVIKLYFLWLKCASKYFSGSWWLAAQKTISNPSAKQHTENNFFRFFFRKVYFRLSLSWNFVRMGEENNETLSKQPLDLSLSPFSSLFTFYCLMCSFYQHFYSFFDEARQGKAAASMT